jgi:hypothetical protein
LPVSPRFAVHISPRRGEGNRGRSFAIEIDLRSSVRDCSLEILLFFQRCSGERRVVRRSRIFETPASVSASCDRHCAIDSFGKIRRLATFNQRLKKCSVFWSDRSG